MKEFALFSCVIDIFSKYAWIISFKDKNGTTITNVFQKILDEANQKPNKIWTDKNEINEIMARKK